VTTPPIVAPEMLHTKTVMALVLSVTILIAIAPITNYGMKCRGTLATTIQAQRRVGDDPSGLYYKCLGS
jgi:hypothetical protein